MTETLKIRMIALAVLAALVLPSTAIAQSSQEGYGGPNNVVAGIEESGGDDNNGNNGTPPAPEVVNVASETASSDEGGSLPFTGADLGVLLLAGGLMVALGFGLRRITHRPSQI